MPWLMVVSALVLVVMSFLAYDAAASVRYSPWTPVVGGIIFSVPLGAVGLLLVRSVGALTERPLLIEKRRLLLGALGLIAWIALGCAYLVQVGNASTYQGAFNRDLQRWEPNFSEKGFFALTLGLALVYPTGVSIAAARFLYYGALKPVSDTVAGRDPMGEIMAGRQRA